MKKALGLILALTCLVSVGALADVQNRYDPDAGGDILSFGDLNRLLFGDASYFAWNTQDANANCFMLDLPTGGSVDVPVFAIVQAPSDMGYFNGVTQPSLVIEDADGDSYIRLSFSADDTPAITVGGVAATISIPAISAYSWTDDIDLAMGTGTDLAIEFTTADANAHCLLFDLPTGAADSVPVVLFADADADFGYFNGVVEPTVAVENLAGDSYLSWGFSGTTLAQIVTGGSATALSISSPILTLGSTSGTASVTLQSGTGSLSLTSTNDFSFVATDDISIEGNSAGSILNLGCNNDGNAINIGTDNSAADTITIGSALDTSSLAGIAVTVGSTGTTSALTLQSGTGDVTITSTDDCSFTATDDIAINGGSAGSVISIGVNTDGNVIHIGDNDSAADDIDIGSAKDDLDLEGEDITLDTADDGNATVADDWTFTMESAGGIFAVTGTAGLVMNLGTDNSAADTITVGSALDTLSFAGISVTAGSTGTTSALVLQSGTGDVTITSTDDGSFTVTDDLTLNGGSSGSIINLGTNTQGNVVNIASDDTTADTINFGSAKDTINLGGGGNLVNATGAGAVVGATCTAVEYNVNGIHKTVLTVGTLGNIALEDKNDGNGIKIYDFPEGVISLIGGSCNLVVTSDAAITTSYVMSLGTAAAADGSETLTATEANVLPSAVVTCGAGDEDFHDAMVAFAGIDGAAAAIDLYINAAVAAGDISGASNVTATSGTITIYWINAGDY